MKFFSNYPSICRHVHACVQSGFVLCFGTFCCVHSYLLSLCALLCVCADSHSQSFELDYLLYVFRPFVSCVCVHTLTDIHVGPFVMCVCVCADMQSPWCRWTTGSASHHRGGSVSAATSPPTSGSTSLMVPFCVAGASLTALGATTMRWSIITKPSTRWLSNWAPSRLTERVSVRGCLCGGEGGCFNWIMIAVKTVTSKWRERKFIVGAGLNIRDCPMAQHK